ncbi:DNA-binding transcriptional regulator [Actinorhabdospora filicis]|uniref:DNA-binding transcriptional regulator n=1 Tax=Actinorhabdospora filicis TaxID=1785913 RepID=A0A9W6STN7_9ACTN|nr:PLP-dependent aminotransferase family protein [Actinorhabdospora filicis]GLZ81868.1 DNA-binding transcriptional regulator [Actinorhabdospora filicis]
MDRSEIRELLGDWSAGDGPLYQQLTERLRRAIADGDLTVGQRLPSERALAESLAVSRATVVTAYEALRAERLVSSRQGSGTVVARSALTDVARRAGDGRVKNGQAGMIFQRLLDGPGQKLISLSCAADPGSPWVAKALAELDLPALLSNQGYHPRGLPELRQAIAAMYREQGLPTSEDQILVTTGAQQAIGLIAQLYARRGNTVIAETPGWPGSVDIFRDAGTDVVGVDLDDEGIDLAGVQRAIERHQPALIYVMPSYNNPTGLVMSATRRRRLAELATRHDIPVCEDNAYDGYSAGAVPPPVAAFAPLAEVLTVGSLGKLVWGGLRIGWVRGPAGIVDRLARRKALADLGSPLLEQAVAARLVPDLPVIRRERAAEAGEQLRVMEELLREELPEWEWRTPDGGGSLWVRVPGVDARVFSQVALRHGVEVVPGTAMSTDGRFTDRIRVPFTFPAQTIDTLVCRLGSAWREARRHGAPAAMPERVIV